MWFNLRNQTSSTTKVSYMIIERMYVVYKNGHSCKNKKGAGGEKKRYSLAVLLTSKLAY